MPIVDTTQPITAARCDAYILAIVEAYPFCRTEVITETAFSRPVRTLVIGNGPRKVVYSAAHHANEWITSLLLLKFAEEFARAIRENRQILGQNAADIAAAATIYMVPMVNPDGVDLVVGATEPGTVEYEIARRLSENYPSIPFPDGWKANLLGVDLNLQYPAGWLQAREIKFDQGFTRPGPRDYVGRAPLTQLESRALLGYTEFIDPALVLAFHTQGQLIFWTFRDIEVPGAEELGREFADLSGYTLADVPFESSFAGYKDWFIQNYRRPGYTIEAGLGTNPLPIEQFDEMYAATLPIMLKAATG